VQVAIAQINEQIGAAGVVNQECKQVVAGYGLQIAGLLEAQVVRETDELCSYLVMSHVNNPASLVNIQQTPPSEVCSKVGLCAFDGTRGVRFVQWLESSGRDS
jgi:phytepsin